MKLMSIAGARPNFMKLASIARAIEKHNTQLKQANNPASSSNPINHIIVHTGQHYDVKMSQSFFEDLGIPKPDINLEVGSGSHAQQTAEIMKKFEPVLQDEQPNVLLIVGDVNSTIACTLVASKIEYSASQQRRPVIVHVEAGLRSFDRDMPEEVNRILTDSISDLLFVTEESGRKHLLAEGIDEKKVHFVGNVMIDTLRHHLDKAAASSIKQQLEIASSYVLVTLHRPSNVDQEETLQSLIHCLQDIAGQCQVVFPVHPRTRNSLKTYGLWQRLENNPAIILAEPLGYLDFLNLIKDATVVVTDSGGIQEETTALQVPCVTLRENTERPVTVDVGTNYLIGTDPSLITETVAKILTGQGKKGSVPELWDGQAGERIVSIISAVVSS